MFLTHTFSQFVIAKLSFVLCFKLLTEDCIFFLFWTSVKDRICNSRNVGILTCPSPATAAPYTSPNTTTLTLGTELGINITESVIRDKSETVRMLPTVTTEAELRTGTLIIAGEKTTETTKPGSTKNEAKRGKCISENEVVEMRKSM